MGNIITQEIKDNLVPKAVNELTGNQFFIPHYQRGYRWTNQQVTQLLNDIDTFTPKEIKGKSEKTFYCLQPVVVKIVNEETKKENDLEGLWYEVIDGQQRLTTIYLLIHYINDLWSGRQKNDNFKINYETRENCVQFLNDIKVNDDEVTVDINKTNIDFFHISSAYQTIRNWEINYVAETGKKLDSAEFQSKFLAYSKIIWYEVNEDEKSKPLFERLNLGKIPLTNAELTKALFLSSDSFNHLTKEERHIKQYEIANLWDEIEYKLNEPDSKFWSFITNKSRALYDTKIDLILDMIADKADDEKDHLFTFLHFTNKQKTIDLASVWLEIEHFYYTIVEWSKDRNLYHKIGFLIASKTFSKEPRITLGELVKKSMILKKDSFESSIIDDEIKKMVKFEISELRYKDHPSQIFNTLLLFNVETYRNSDAITEYYPFKQHKDNSWSLEHIHARNSESFDKNKKDPWIKWLDLHVQILQELQQNPQVFFDSTQIEVIIEQIEKYNNPLLTWERFSDLFKKVNDLFTEDAESMDRESEGLSNLALLSMPDNAALNNSVFEVKRREIINLDKKGSFIPICTRRVFMKYYFDDGLATQNFFWSSDDRRNYFDEIKKCLNKSGYLPVNHIDLEEDED